MQTLLCLFIPVLAIPALIGAGLLRRGQPDTFARMAALLTLKPVLTTPIWWLVTFSVTPVTLPAAILGIVPGAALAVLALVVFRPLLFGRAARRSAWLLVVLDCLRWSNSYLIATSSYYAYLPQSETLIGRLTQFSGIAGLLLPTLFAVVAWRIASADTPQT